MANWSDKAFKKRLRVKRETFNFIKHLTLL